MNELEDMCTDVRPPEPGALAEGRRRLTAAAQGQERVRVRRSRTPWMLGIATAMGVAVAAGVVAVAAPGNGVGPGHVGGPTGKTSRPGEEIRLVSATEVLGRAATAAGKEPDLNPRADQYIHITSTEYTTDQGRVSRERWLSVNGRKDDVLRTSPCLDRKRSTCDTSMGKTSADFTPEYYRKLPTDPLKLAAWLRQLPVTKRPLDQRMWMNMWERILEQYLPPKVAAAMFTVAGEIPGVRLVKDVKDPAGRDGVGVSKTIDGEEQQLIFDRRTFRFLGMRQVTGSKPAKWSFALLGVSTADSAPVGQQDSAKKPQPK